jgi:type IV pilus modification protein PilV
MHGRTPVSGVMKLKAKCSRGLPGIHARGFSLVEVLVTIVVLSIGALGVTRLLAHSKQAGFESVQRSTAAQLGYALLEDMRANTAGMGVYLSAGTLGRGSRGSSEPTPTCSTGGASCTPSGSGPTRATGRPSPQL